MKIKNNLGLYISIILFVATTSSLFLFLVPFLSNVTIKLILSSVSLLIIFAILYKKLNVKVKLLEKIIYLCLMGIFFVYFVYSFLLEDISLQYILRDFRIYVVFFLVFILFRHASNINLLTHISNFFLFSSLILSFFYFLIGKIIVPDVTVYSLMEKTLPLSKVEGLKMVAVNKIKYTPYVITYCQIYILLKDKIKLPIIILIEIIIITEVISSNMRSVYLFWILSLIFVIFIKFTQNIKYDRFLIRYFSFIIIFFASIFSLPKIVDILSTNIDRFYSQILKRGIDPDKRDDVIDMIFSFGFFEDVGIYGLGFGTQYIDYIRNKYMNPIDSLTFYYFSYFGYIFGFFMLILTFIVVIYILFILFKVLQVVHKEKDWSEKNLIIISSSLSLIFAFINGFNDSFIAFIADSVIVATLLGISLNKYMLKFENRKNI